MKLAELVVSKSCLLIAAAAISSWLLPSAKASDCNVGENQLEFTLFLDEDSVTENGWSLTCDGEGTVWNVAVGTIQSVFPDVIVDPDINPSPFVTEKVCLPEDTTCTFTLEDTHGDGLLSPGYYYLTLGPTTIAVSEEGEEFKEKSYCFGPSCQIVAREVAENCDYVYLHFQADDHPEESSVEITCNGSTIFSKSDFTTPGEAIEFEQCVPPDQCCALTIHDSESKNGLNSLEGGHVLLEWANQVILRYDATNDYEFETLSRNFGSTCPEVDPLDDKSEDQGDSTEENQDPNSSLEQDMAKERKGMSSTIKIGLVFFSVLVILGLLALLMARFVYTPTHRIELDRTATATRTKSTTKDVEVQSVSSKDTKESEDDF